jgi:uroporphyrin-III C-methyltransferase
MATISGTVWLVGAGPGDPELLTLKGKKCIEVADTILYDELVNAELLAYARAGCEIRYVGKRAGERCTGQRAIEAQLIDCARQGKNIVRLKGGDPFVFGRGGEEAQALRAAGINFEIVPGISAAIAAPAYAGIPVTHRACASSMAVVTGHKATNNKIRWGELARSVDTLVIMMGLRNLPTITGALLAGGCEPDRPAALIQSGTRVNQKTSMGSVATIVNLARMENFRSPTIVVIGQVANFAREIPWFHESGRGESSSPANNTKAHFCNLSSPNEQAKPEQMHNN